MFKHLLGTVTDILRAGLVRVLTGTLTGREWNLTYSGMKFYPLAPEENKIHIVDIAHSTSQICRYTGHTINFYSVAEHQVLASYEESDPFLALQILLHDGAEAYWNDISSPIKKTFIYWFYRYYIHKTEVAIYRKFGLPIVEPEEIKRADKAIFTLESDVLFPNRPVDWELPAVSMKNSDTRIMCWTPPEAKAKYLERFEYLINECAKFQEGEHLLKSLAPEYKAVAIAV